MKIRKATITEVEELSYLFGQYREFYRQKADVKKSLLFLTERIERNESQIYIAYVKEKIAGFTQLYPCFSSVSLKRLWILNDLFVAKEFRRQGIAKNLIKHICQDVNVQGHKGLTLKTEKNNLKAQKLYTSLGWVKEDGFLTFNYSLN